jgi:hypothetical protein
MVPRAPPVDTGDSDSDSDSGSGSDSDSDSDGAAVSDSDSSSDDGGTADGDGAEHGFVSAPRTASTMFGASKGVFWKAIADAGYHAGLLAVLRSCEESLEVVGDAALELLCQQLSLTILYDATGEFKELCAIERAVAAVLSTRDTVLRFGERYEALLSAVDDGVTTAYERLVDTAGDAKRVAFFIELQQLTDAASLKALVASACKVFDSNERAYCVDSRGADTVAVASRGDGVRNLASNFLERTRRIAVVLAMCGRFCIDPAQLRYVGGRLARMRRMSLCHARLTPARACALLAAG